MSKDRINRKIRQILNALGYSHHELSVLITGNREIKELNQKYRGLDQPTNVLAFPMQEGEFTSISSSLLGDIAISAEKAAEEAKEAGITVDERMSQLLIHGILHLIGYDHETGEEGADKMERKSLELIRLIEPDKKLDIF